MINTLKSIFSPYPETENPWPWQYVLLAWIKFNLKLSLLDQLTFLGIGLFAFILDNFFHITCDDYDAFNGSVCNFKFFVCYAIFLLVYFICSFVLILKLFKKINKRQYFNYFFSFFNTLLFPFIVLLDILSFVSFGISHNFYIIFLIFLFSKIIMLIFCQLGINHYLRHTINKTFNRPLI